MSARSSGSAVSSSKRPPLNQSTRVKPTWPPLCIAAKSRAAFGAKVAGSAREASSIFWKSVSGSRLTSSANMQKTRRLTKWATAWGSWPRARSRWARSENCAAASAVRASRVFVGRRRSGSVKAARRRSRLAPSSRSSSRRVCASWTVLVKLVRMTMRSVSQVTRSGGFSSAAAYMRSWRWAASRSLCRALVFPAEGALAPDVGPALAAGGLGGALLEGEPVALRVGGAGSSRPSRRQRSLKWVCAADALLERDGPPLGDELCGRHAGLLGAAALRGACGGA